MDMIAIVLALLRGMHMIALLSLFGTLFFLSVVARTAMENGVAARRAILCVAQLSTIGGLLIGLVWLVVETAVIAGVDTVARTFHALPMVALHTQFGHVLLLRCALLVVTFPLLARGRAGIDVGAVLSGAAVALQPLLGHVGAIGGSFGADLIACELLHMLAAGAWLGGLLPLFISVGALSPNTAANVCRSFTPVGLCSVLVLAGTAVVQAAAFVGGLPGLFGTRYGQIALVKLGIFGLLLMLAALNRLTLTDRLDNIAPAAARQQMRLSIAAEMMLGALVIVTAGFLASHTPGTHEQPIWPFAWRPSLDVLAEPELRHEVLFAFAGVGGSILLAAVGLASRRIRWPALAFSALVLALALPHLGLLLVPAYSTSFYTSPTEFAATSIARGAELFAAHCIRCHGTDGRGGGDAAAQTVRPADLTAEHLWAHSDGEMFWYISHGFQAFDGAITMPGFDGVLSGEARWHLIDYLRAHNAGESMRLTGKWQHPLPMPQMDAACEHGTIDLDDLRGRPLLVITVPGDAGPADAGDHDVMRILLSRKPVAVVHRAACIALEPDAWTAFAIILGLSPDALAGAQVLVDRNTWLRQAWRPGDVPDWKNPVVFTKVLREIATHPLPLDFGAAHTHGH